MVRLEDRESHLRQRSTDQREVQRERRDGQSTGRGRSKSSLNSPLDPQENRTCVSQY